MRLFGKLMVVLMVVGMLATVGISYVGRLLATPGPLAQTTDITIPPGTSARLMGQKLADAHVISNPALFYAVVRFSGLAPTLKAGEYLFEPGISMRQAINKLALGQTAPRQLTIPEGYTLRQIKSVLEKTPGLAGPAATVSSPLPIEGHVFPDTYSYVSGNKRTDVLRLMSERMDKELAAAWAARAADTPYKTPEDLLILASIVQKEAANEGEMPRIAAAFTNRLKKGMKLQADPTVIYGADLGGTNDLKTRDMNEPQPFNTYVIEGLPPTAISSPGREALMAAAQPAATDDIFFVALPDRSGHVFTSTYAEHQKAVKAYWAGQKQEAAKLEAAKAEKVARKQAAPKVSVTTVVSGGALVASPSLVPAVSPVPASPTTARPAQ